MFKSLPALAAVMLFGTFLIALTALAPKVEASETAALAKGDRLQVGAPQVACASQIWPDLTASCLRSNDGAKKILEARLVTARR